MITGLFESINYDDPLSCKKEPLADEWRRSLLWRLIFCGYFLNLFDCRCVFAYLLFLFTALFTNMRILKFKSQPTITFFATVNHLNGPHRKQNFTLTGSKGQGLGFVIGGFRFVLCVSVFQGSLLVMVIMIDGSEKRNCERGFWTLEFACLWKRSNECVTKARSSLSRIQSNPPLRTPA